MALDALRCNHLAPLGFKGLRLSVISVGVVLVVKLTRKVKALFRNCGRSHDAYSGLAIRNL